MLVLSVAGTVVCALLVIYIFAILCICPDRCDNSLCHGKCTEMMQAVEETTLVGLAVGGFLSARTRGTLHGELVAELDSGCTLDLWYK
jgi:hypothetical protein